KRLQQGERGADKAALKHAHGQTRCRTVEHFGFVVNVTEVLCRFIVESLLADLSLREVIAKSVRDARGVKGSAIQVHHLFFCATDKMELATSSRIVLKRLVSRQHLGFQQLPQSIERIILAHVGRGGEKQQVVRTPGKRPRRLQTLDSSQGLSDMVAIGLSDI